MNSDIVPSTGIIHHNSVFLARFLPPSSQIKRLDFPPRGMPAQKFSEASLAEKKVFSTRIAQRLMPKLAL